MATCDQQILNRLKRAEGQIRGIQKMITDGKECLKRRSLEFELNSASSFRLINILFCVICSLE